MTEQSFSTVRLDTVAATGRNLHLELEVIPRTRESRDMRSSLLKMSGLYKRRLPDCELLVLKAAVDLEFIPQREVALFLDTRFSSLQYDGAMWFAVHSLVWPVIKFVPDKARAICLPGPFGMLNVCCDLPGSGYQTDAGSALFLIQPVLTPEQYDVHPA